MEIEIGFLGLGIMEKAMFLNLLRHGFEVTVWNRILSKSPILSVVSIGETPATVVKKYKYTIMMLSDPSAALSVVFEKDGVLEQICEGKGYIDMSIVDADTSSKISESGQFLEAPIFGSKKPAEDDQLVILATEEKVILATQFHFNYTTPNRTRHEMHEMLRTKTPLPTEHWPFIRGHVVGQVVMYFSDFVWDVSTIRNLLFIVEGKRLKMERDMLHDCLVLKGGIIKAKVDRRNCINLMETGIGPILGEQVKLGRELVVLKAQEFTSSGAPNLGEGLSNIFQIGPV
ncbi:hypothetical protein GIB67_020646 [Kingdonia uniflora]|uniref:6-phosphogluconate dehydrogenase NADP-binding domain-containing protein n=1 Tax=Kingdonia uniflora TaxID=39325 RepID=A0A7J7M999_9MAGN|nr:hypothetical protein GIB67_020646 [Kingdonia uniflora]